MIKKTMEIYAVISRTVAHDIGIDWIYPNIITDNIEEAKEEFFKEKEIICKSLSKCCDKTIVRDENNVFCVEYNNTKIRRYVKLINLY